MPAPSAPSGTPAPSANIHHPDATVGGLWRASLPLLVPPAAWIGALGLSWLIQEFTCTATLSAGAPVPETALFVTLMVLNAVLLIITVVCGVVSVRALRKAGRAGAPLMRFIGLTGIFLAVLFAFGIVLIGVQPLVMEVC